MTILSVSRRVSLTLPTHCGMSTISSATYVLRNSHRPFSVLAIEPRLGPLTEALLPKTALKSKQPWRDSRLSLPYEGYRLNRNDSVCAIWNTIFRCVLFPSPGANGCRRYKITVDSAIEENTCLSIKA